MKNESKSGTSQGNGIDIEGLFEAAREEGALSAEAMQALHITDLGAQIQAGFGVQVDDVASSEVVLVTVMPDDSGSIKFAGNAQAVRDGHNLVVSALADSKQRDSLLAHNRYLNGAVLYPYCPIAQAEKMTSKNYDPELGTPLYDQAVVLLGTVIAKAQEFALSGVPARTVTLFITDGADAGSTWAKAKDVCALVRDMRRAEAHIVAAIGIDDGNTNYRAVFRDMGIEDRWILTPRSDAAEIRKAFALFSQSAVRASQGGASFSRAAAGGFGG
ncbi:hypothetical protein SOCE26_026870 [Sorangium cellulosum]|uniref:VWFA domain-containing protein n=1 Tax=Sorangium cellulosum TaxID=56 RepID=A0A2L0EPN8_SORCE|nr:hypothetical protein [Sorangium cellulosum]AUX41277.1 hypothetical protein SOCE26_026870 [Sorangium cellulosum]